MSKSTNKSANENSENNEGTETETETTGTGKKRLRKIYFTCAAVKLAPKRDAENKPVKEDGKQVMESQLAVEEIEVPSVKDREIASDAFKKSQGLAPTNILGPYYRVRGTASAEKRVAVVVPIQDCKMSGKIWHGTFQGWEVYGHGIKKFKSVLPNGKEVTYGDDEVTMLFFGDLADKNSDLPKPRFGGRQATVLRSAIENAKLQQE